MENETIALIELGGSHDECIYSQVLFLKKKGIRVQVILFNDHFNRMEAFPGVDIWKTFPSPRGWLAEWILVFRLLAYLKQHGIRKAVLNTAEGNIIRKLSLAPGRYTEFSGILHLSSKLWTSKSQKIISRKVSKYFVLADFIRDNIKKTHDSIPVEHFYPIYFPAEDRAGQEAEGQQVYRVCIPGAVDFTRRDYQSLIDEMLGSRIPAGVKFVLLGRTRSNDGKELMATIKGKGLEQHFTLFDGFIPHRQFYEEMRKAWIVLPLITPRCRDYNDYMDYKITGSFNLAYGFRQPMLLHDSFARRKIYRETSLFFPDGGLFRTIRRCMEDPTPLEAIKKSMAEKTDFRLDHQAEKYIGFIYGPRRFRQ